MATRSNLMRNYMYTILLAVAPLHCLGEFPVYADYEGTLKAINLNSTSELMEYKYAEASFGPSLPTDPNHLFKGIVHEASPIHGCSKLKPPPFRIRIPSDYGWLAVVERSDSIHPNTPTCTFIEKTMNVQRAGYSGIIVYNYMGSSGLIPMGTDNDTAADQVVIHAVFVDYVTGTSLKRISYPDYTPYLWALSFKPNPNSPFDPYKILIPLAFSFVGVLMVTCIVMIVRWCQGIRRRQRSRMSRSQLKKIPIKKYKPGDKYDCCTICLDDYIEGDKLRFLPCQHTYHQKCIDPWLLKNKKTCPVCKRRVIPRRRHAESESESDEERQRLITEPTTSGADNSGSVGTYGSIQTGAQEVNTGAVLTRSSSSSDNSDEEIRRPRRRRHRRPVLPVGRAAAHGNESDSPSGYDDEDPLLLNTARIAFQISMTSHDGSQAHSLHSIDASTRHYSEPDIPQARINHSLPTGDPYPETTDLTSETGNEGHQNALDSTLIDADDEPEAQATCDVHTVDETRNNVVV